MIFRICNIFLFALQTFEVLEFVLHSGGLGCTANLGGSWWPGFPSLIQLRHIKSLVSTYLSDFNLSLTFILQKGYFWHKLCKFSNMISTRDCEIRCFSKIFLCGKYSSFLKSRYLFIYVIKDIISFLNI